MSVVLEGLQKKFDGTLVIDNLSATFRRGAVSVLLGASGCGKTTTLNGRTKKEDENETE